MTAPTDTVVTVRRTLRQWGLQLGFALLWLMCWYLPGWLAVRHLANVFTTAPNGLREHLLLLTALWLALLLPVTPELLQRRAQRSTLAALGLLLALGQLTMLAFYALSAVGHEQWGDWMTWALAKAYGPQLASLLDVLGIPPWPVLAGVVLVLVLLAALHGWLWARLLACVPAAPWPRWPGATLLIVQTAALLVFAYSYGRDDDLWWREPLRFANFKETFGDAGTGRFFDPAQLQAEREAIAAYAPPPARGPRRPLLLVIVDSLRADQMGVYGGPVDNTPFLSRLAAEGNLQALEPAYSVCTVSYCGILGILSSHYWRQITPQPWNIADALRKQGYESRFVLSGDHTSYFGLRQMFGTAVDHVEDGTDSRHLGYYVNDDFLVPEALDRLGWPQQRPGFLYVHLMSSHRLGWIAHRYRLWSEADAPAFSAYGPLDGSRNGETRARYHNGIRQTDAMLESLFERLATWGILDTALVVITADHGDFLGEQFGGRTWWSHSGLPFEPVVRVPLLVYDPLAKAPWPMHALASTVDIAPTLLHAIGAQRPLHWSGVPLQEAAGHELIEVESADSRGMVVLRDGRRFKYLRFVETGGDALFELPPGGQGEVVDLSRDPAFADTLRWFRQGAAP